jgi:hypothetical protein
MINLVKGLVCLVVVAILAYAAYFIPLEKKTLWEHMVGISKTDEAKDLGKEIEKKVDNVTDKVTDELKRGASKIADQKIKEKLGLGDESDERVDTPPTEHSKNEREALDDLVRKKMEPETPQKDRIEKKSASTGPNKEDRQALNQLLHDKINKHN